MTDTFTCWLCQRTFPKGWGDDEALAELGENFPGTSVEECELVCDDCYRGIGLGLSGREKPLTKA